MGITTFASIYIGSYEVRLKIMEISAKRGVREIDYVRSRIRLGRNIYKYGKIKMEVMEELCEILSEYKEIMKSYRVDKYRVYAGSFLKEAENELFLLEQIQIHTGMPVRILSNSEKRFIGYHAVAAREEFEEMTKARAAVVDIGGESIQITLFSDGNVITTQHLVLGTLRLKEKIADIDDSKMRYEKQMEEMINKEIEVFKSMYLRNNQPKYLILSGDYSSELIRNVLKSAEGITAKSEVFVDYLKKLGKEEPEDIAEKLGFSQVDPLLVPAIVVYRCMAEKLEPQEVWVPGSDINDGIAYHYAREHKLLKNIHDFDKDILSAAANISKRYHSYSPHINALAEMSVMIFDTIKKIHGMGSRERLLMQVAAILHDCGKYISLANGPDCSHQIIMSSEIIGLSHLEREIVASTVWYNTRPLDTYESVADRLDEESYRTAAKLAAILRVANALDRSHKQKFKTIQVVLRKKQLLITVETKDDIVLERGLLASKSGMFESIFGIKPILREKKSF